MVRAFASQKMTQDTKSFQLKRMFDFQGGKSLPGLVFDHDGNEDEQLLSPAAEEPPLEIKHQNEAENTPSPKCQGPSDMELMKEKFSKLLLGEDMSGGGKGVSSALALSNAITNLAASVFGETRKLEPMSPDRKARWVKEIGWLLSVCDHIVEFVPAQQDGTNMEIMVTQQRKDLHMDIPALRKLDAMLLGHLESFANPSEFWYVKKGDSQDDDQGSKPPRNDEKWWLPTVKVPSEGLSEEFRKWMQFQKDSVNQVLKAAMAINAQVLSEMDVPENYIESLPKNGRASLGDTIYRSITEEMFDPLEFLTSMDLSSEHKVLDLKDRIEASIVIWKRKMNQKETKSSWSSGVSRDQRELFEERVETVLLIIKQKFPGIPQSALDISKIQYNKDVGFAIMESYSRVIESLAFNVMSMIDDVLHADRKARTERSTRRLSVDSYASLEDPERLSCAGTPSSKTLFEFMGWQQLDEPEADKKKDNKESYCRENNDQIMSKPPPVSTKRFSYLEKLEKLSGLRSPTARH